jgi:hypothetical protein
MFRLGLSGDPGVMKGDERRCWRSECREWFGWRANPSSLPASVFEDDFARPQSCAVSTVSRRGDVSIDPCQAGWALVTCHYNSSPSRAPGR